MITRPYELDTKLVLLQHLGAGSCCLDKSHLQVAREELTSLPASFSMAEDPCVSCLAPLWGETPVGCWRGGVATVRREHVPVRVHC